MSYLELLKLVSPEAIVVVTALMVLAIGLTKAEDTKFSSFVAIIGLAKKNRLTAVRVARPLVENENPKEVS